MMAHKDTTTSNSQRNSKMDFKSVSKSSVMLVLYNFSFNVLEWSRDFSNEITALTLNVSRESTKRTLNAFNVSNKINHLRLLLNLIYEIGTSSTAQVCSRFVCQNQQIRMQNEWSCNLSLFLFTSMSIWFIWC